MYRFNSCLGSLNMIRIKNILFPTDFSDFSKYAASFAVSFACDYGAKLHVLHVVEMPHVGIDALPAKITMDELASKASELAAQEIEAASTPEMLDGLDYEVTSVNGKPFLEVIRFARSKDIDIPEVNGKPFGSVACMGFDARVNELARTPVRLPGSTPAYVWSVMRALRDVDPLALDIRIYY